MSLVKKYHQILKKIVQLSNNDPIRRIKVQDINANLSLDRTEIKNVLAYMQELGYISIKTIGGPLLYGHITVTESGLKKYRELSV
ncbi:MAG: hypothetical protein U5J63_10640 [Fodinibius sp.]|nr:hypothetical protein [Fodinibius sp.]